MGCLTYAHILNHICSSWQHRISDILYDISMAQQKNIPLPKIHSNNIKYKSDLWSPFCCVPKICTQLLNNDTVDGWNPANQLISSLSHSLHGFYTSQVVIARFLPSTVWVSGNPTSLVRSLLKPALHRVGWLVVPITQQPLHRTSTQELGVRGFHVGDVVFTKIGSNESWPRFNTYPEWW